MKYLTVKVAMPANILMNLRPNKIKKNTRRQVVEGGGKNIF